MGGFAVLADIRHEVDDDDRALVEAAQKEPAAFAAIYERHAQRIYLYVRSRVPSEDDAVDITQQVFVNCLRALPRYRLSGAPFLAWLFRIARNSVVDYHRRSRLSYPLDAVPPLLREQNPGPEDVAVQNEDSTRLRTALQSLSPPDREMLALRYAGGLRMREIAEATGKSEDAVKKRLSRALKTLKDSYDATL